MLESMSRLKWNCAADDDEPAAGGGGELSEPTAHGGDRSDDCLVRAGRCLYCVAARARDRTPFSSGLGCRGASVFLKSRGERRTVRRYTHPLLGRAIFISSP